MKHWKQWALALLAVAGLNTLNAEDRKPTADKKPADDNQPFTDAEFVKKAASGGMAEVALGQIGAKQAKSEELKTFANRLVKDHTKANEELKTAAKAAGIECPTEIDEEAKKHVEMFKNYDGNDFDSQYAKHMVEDHEKDIALFTKASKEAKNAELKAFAEKTLPVLKEHLELAKKAVK